ncbi:MAG: HPr(Ser) kinase/phosphatase [candidate division Zixibacteria bacterium HGW-Zixibacteria-1]|nr:MAG: HPr(Ser) kinase/phosphatase [candidate division Zixibacteria bacterium HGW-Zixibacteria-1]
MPELTVEKFYKERKDFFDLTLLNSEIGLKKRIMNAETHRPGLALAGFMDRFPNQRTQVLGETEMTYINQLSPEGLIDTCELIFGNNVPLVIIAKGITPPLDFLAIADKFKTAVFSSRLTTSELLNRLSVVLDVIFAPSITVHGTLVDVYGVGLLYTGKSGIGKSEIALDLVERGHRLVADDVIKITRKAPDLIVGTGSELLGHHMEVRGIGIIDVEKLFGIRSIRLQKRIEVEVHLTLWSDDIDIERLGIDERGTTILGVQIPQVMIPISPGKNITVISEVIAMNHMLKTYGENTAMEFSKRLAERIHRQAMTKDYLESDYE